MTPKRISDFCEEKARKGEGLFAVAYALLEIADLQKSIAVHVKYLGNGDAATTMGAIEAFGMHLGEKLDSLTGAIQDLRSSE
jgi:hypothetical protein